MNNDVSSTYSKDYPLFGFLLQNHGYMARFGPDRRVPCPWWMSLSYFRENLRLALAREKGPGT